LAVAAAVALAVGGGGVKEGGRMWQQGLKPVPDGQGWRAMGRRTRRKKGIWIETKLRTYTEWNHIPYFLYTMI
jgi:hypothetical protein